MNWLNSTLILLVAFLAIFLESVCDGFRHWFGAQINFLPALMVYASLSAGLPTMCAVAIMGGLLFDTLSANTLGVTILPLFMMGYIIYLRREMILRDQFYAQLVLGLIASSLVPLTTLLLLVLFHHAPSLGWHSLWQWIVMSVGGAVLTPICFWLFGGLNRGLNYQPAVQSSFRPDREIRRGATNMLVFDQLRKNDPQLRFLAVIVLGGMLVLLSGLWWVQLVSSKRYQTKLETQSVRTVRIPAVRGKILDRDGLPLADSKPNYSIDIYLQDLSTNYEAAYNVALGQAKKYYSQQRDLRQAQLGRKLNPQELKAFQLTPQTRGVMQQQIRYDVTSNMVVNLSAHLQQPIALGEKQFENHYLKSRALPLPVLGNLNPVQLARFEEQSDNLPGMNLEVQSIRYYPNGPIAAHLLGYLSRNDEPDEDNRYNYRLPDFKGQTGIEGLYDDQLQGIPGEKSVVVNYLGYRQSETVLQQPEAGQNVVLTIDSAIQKAADAALEKAQAKVRGAVVVMDPQTGDILAMASAPSYDPNHRIHPDPATYEQEQESWNDETLGLQRNRSIYENYHPGSIFKIVVGMAALEKNVCNPDEKFLSDGFYQLSPKSRPIRDTAGAGYFDFYRALAKSSNPYFINEGIKPGVLPEIILLGERLHLGEKTGIMPRQETGGNFPTMKRINSHWHLGDTANLSIGQGEIDVTPVQMAVMVSAVANGGTVFLATIGFPDSECRWHGCCEIPFWTGA